jgi:arylsulfatase A-like enzyme
MCLQLMSLDRDLGDFFSVLDRQGIDYAVALTADHGGFDIPARVPGAASVDGELGAAALGKRIGAKLGLKGSVLFGDYAGDIYIDRTLPARDRERVRAEALSVYRAHPQVEAVFTREQVAAALVPSTPPNAWSLLERLSASYDPQRSGDLLVVLKRNIAPYPATSDIASTHGTPWDYDRRVPIAFWRPGLAAQQREEAIETVDMMPTLAAMLGLRIDRTTIDGTCLESIPGIVCQR